MTQAQLLKKYYFLNVCQYFTFVLHPPNKTDVKLAVDVFQNDTEWIVIELQLRLTTLLLLMTIIIR